MPERLCASILNRTTPKRRGRDGGIVDHPVYQHLGNGVFDIDGISSNPRELPSELLFPRQHFPGALYPNVMFLQLASPMPTGRRTRLPRGAPSTFSSA
jgi:hypothetical protein